MNFYNQRILKIMLILQHDTACFLIDQERVEQKIVRRGLEEEGIEQMVDTAG